MYKPLSTTCNMYLWCCGIGNVVQAHLAVLTVMTIGTLTNVLKKQEEEMRKGNGWKWND